MAITFKRAGDKPPSALDHLRAGIAAKPSKAVSILKAATVKAAGILTEKQAAVYLGISVFTLQRIRKREEIEFKQVGSRIRYTYEFLENYLKSSEQPCKTASKSETSGFHSAVVPKNITPPPSTAGPDKQTAAALAQKTFKKPKSSSPSS